MQWADREPLPRQRVEAIDLLDTSPARLRELERGGVLPHASAATREIPALHAALVVARELGDPVRDGEVTRSLGAPALIDTGRPPAAGWPTRSSATPPGSSGASPAAPPR